MVRVPDTFSVSVKITRASLMKNPLMPVCVSDVWSVCVCVRWWTLSASSSLMWKACPSQRSEVRSDGKHSDTEVTAFTQTSFFANHKTFSRSIELFCFTVMHLCKCVFCRAKGPTLFIFSLIFDQTVILRLSDCVLDVLLESYICSLFLGGYEKCVLNGNLKCHLLTKKYVPLSHLQPHTHTNTHTKHSSFYTT